jgi:hypothetical protein
MDDQKKAALEKAMKDFDQKRSAAAKRQEATEAKRAEFARALERCFEEVIRPEMEEVKNTLAKGKHECTISEQKRTATTDLPEQPDHIRLEIKPAPRASGGHVTMSTRTIYFAAVPREGKIVIGTGSIPEYPNPREGMRYEPSRLTRDEVAKQLVSFVKEVLA